MKKSLTKSCWAWEVCSKKKRHTDESSTIRSVTHVKKKHFWIFPKILSSFTDPQLDVAIEFHCMEKNTIEVNGFRQLFGTHIRQNIFFCTQQKKLVQVWNNLRVTKWLVFIFGWTVPLNQIDSIPLSINTIIIHSSAKIKKNNIYIYIYKTQKTNNGF